MNYSEDLSFGDIELTPNRCGSMSINSKSVRVSYGQHLLLGKLCAVVSFPDKSVSALGNHIDGIVFDGTEKQMAGVATGGNVTVVTHQKSIRDCSNGKNPSKPMNTPGFAMERKSSVTIGEFSSSPVPTLCRPKFIDSRPKTFGAIRSLGHIKKAPATIEVKPAQWSGNDDNEGERVLVSTVFKAALRPSQN